MISKAVNNKLQVNAAILNFSMPFDKVTHFRLLYKLKLLWDLIDSFLHGRSEQVVVDGVACEVTLGVPQGSVLGPTLYLIINDIIIILNVKCEMKHFADDTHMYRTIQNSNDHEYYKNT